MRNWKWSIMAAASLASLWAVALPNEASASCPIGEPLAPGNITQAAHQAYDAGPQRAQQALVAGLRQARASVPGRLRSLEATAVPEFSTAGDSAHNEYSADVVLTVELGQLAEARREHLAAMGDEAQAEAEQRRWEYVFAAQEAYLDWWTAALEVAHLAEYVEEAAADVEPLRSALERQRVAAIDVADMEAEVARIRAERLEAAQRAERAAAALSGLLGGRCEMASVGLDSIDLASVGLSQQQPSATDSDNPWGTVRERVEQFPVVEMLDARRKRALAGAEAAAAQAPWELSVGAGVRSVGFEDHFVLGVIGLSIPLGNPAAPEADRLQAAAIAARAESEWQIQQLRAVLAARAERFEATAATYRALNDDYLAPLEERQEMLDAAVDRGRVSIDRVIRARRDLHEAHHKLLMLRAELQTNQMRARAMHQWLEADTTYQTDSTYQKDKNTEGAP